ncbi:Ankyrin repeat-containing domain protein [Rhypophila sp. PSN 637]
MEPPEPRIIYLPGLVSQDVVQEFWPKAHPMSGASIYYSDIFSERYGNLLPPSEQTLLEAGIGLLDFLVTTWTEEKERPIIIVTSDLGGHVLKQALCRAGSSKIQDHHGLLASIKTLIFVGSPHIETPTQTWESTILRMVSQIGGGKPTPSPSWLSNIVRNLASEHRRLVPEFDLILREFQFQIVQYIQDSRSEDLVVPLEISFLYAATDERIVLVGEYQDIIRKIASGTHRKMLEVLIEDARQATMLSSRWLLEWLRSFEFSYPGFQEPNFNIEDSHATAKTIFELSSVRDWLEADDSDSTTLWLSIREPSDNICQLAYPLPPYLANVHEQGFQKHTVISGTISKSVHHRGFTLSTGLISSLLRQLIQRHPGVSLGKIWSNFDADQLERAFYGSATTLLEATLWKCFQAVISCLDNVICLISVACCNIDGASSIRHLLNRLARVQDDVDCNFKMMVIANDACRNSLDGLGSSVLYVELDNALIPPPMLLDQAVGVFDEMPGPLSSLMTPLQELEAQIQPAVLSQIASALQSVARISHDSSDTQDTSRKRKYLEQILPFRAQRALVAYFTSFFVQGRPGGTEGPVLIALAKVCLQCIDLAARPDDQDTSTKDQQSLGEDRKTMPGTSEQPLLDYAVVFWPVCLLTLLSSEDKTGAEVNEVMPLLTPRVAEKWYTRWMELDVMPESDKEVSRLFSPVEIQKASDSTVALDVTTAISLAAIHILPACNRDEDLALLWGFMKVTGASRAARHCPRHLIELLQDTTRLFVLFGLSPSLAFPFLKEVDESLIKDNLLGLFALSITRGEDVVWRYIRETPGVPRFVIRTHAGKLHLRALGRTANDERAETAKEPPYQLYDPSKTVEAIGFSEFVRQAHGHLGDLFSEMDSKTRRLALHAAVLSGSSKAVDTILDLGLDFDGEEDITRDAIIRVASTHGLYAILEKLLSAFKDTNLDVQDGQQYGETPLIIAARSGHMRTSSILVAHGASLRIHDAYGVYPFVAAVRSGSLGTVRKLLHLAKQQGVDVGLKPVGRIGEQPLIVGLRLGRLSVSEFLVKAGADMNIEYLGFTPLYYAVEMGFAGLVKAALRHYAPIPPRNELEARLEKIERPIDILLEMAASRNELEIVDAILDTGLDVSDRAFQEILVRAALDNQATLVGRLVKRGNVPSIAMSEAVQYATFDDHVEICNLLLDAGADKDYQDCHKTTSLQLAASNNSLAVLRLFLIRHAKLDLKGPEGRTALMEAVLEEHYAAAKLLIDAGADVNMEDVYGDKAFDMAAKTKSEDMMLLIYSKLKLSGLQARHGMLDDHFLRNLIARDLDTILERVLAEPGAPTPSAADLLQAVQNGGGDPKVLRLLLKHGADPNGQNDLSRGPPIHDAAASCNVEAVRVLLADDNPKGKADVNKTGGWSWSALYSCLRGDTSKKDKDRCATWDLLIEHGADPTDTSGPRGTPLHVAASYGTLAVVDHILANPRTKDKLSVDLPDSEGRIPGHFAAAFGVKDIYPVFLAGDLVHATDKHGRSPIHMAAARGSFRGVNYLLATPSWNMVWKTDSDGWNVLHWACRQDDREVLIRVLKSTKGEPEKLCLAKENIGGWLPWEIAALHDNERYVPIIDRYLQASYDQGQRENSVVDYVAMIPWTTNARSCDSCFARIFGETHICNNCLDFALCFKCFGRVSEFHIYDPEHTFEMS